MKRNDIFGIRGRGRIITTCAKTGKVLRTTPWYNNLIMLGTNTGKDLILDRLAGDNTYTLNITHADIGTGTNVPAVSDTQLQTAVARTTVATVSISGNVITFQFFWADANLANNTYREVGTFVDGTASVNSGRIFNRLLFGTAYTKATGEDTTIEVEFTVS
jgi:hypothetical protein